MHILILNSIYQHDFYVVNENTVLSKNCRNLGPPKEELNNITFYTSLCNCILQVFLFFHILNMYIFCQTTLSKLWVNHMFSSCVYRKVIKLQGYLQPLRKNRSLKILQLKLTQPFFISVGFFNIAQDQGKNYKQSKVEQSSHGLIIPAISARPVFYIFFLAESSQLIH